MLCARRTTPRGDVTWNWVRDEFVKLQKSAPGFERELISGDRLRFSNDLGQLGPENCSERSFHLGVHHVQVPAFITTTY
jgi:hypothetical protein